MKLATAFAGACALMLGLLGVERAGSLAAAFEPPVPPVESRLAPALEAAHTAVAELREHAPSQQTGARAQELSAEPVRLITRQGRVVAAPGGCRSLAQPWDLLVFFHGAPTAVEPAFEQAELEGVLVVVNLGIGSGAYEDHFKDRAAFDQLVERTAGVISEACPGASATPASIALGAWSAGYGAVYSILQHRSERERIDAVLLADGLHAAYLKEHGKRSVFPLQMEPFSDFAERAMAREKLFALTHTEIRTPGYACTTETANYLLDFVHLRRVETNQAGPRRDMWLTSYADGGAFHVRGYSGNSKQAHADHLLGIGRTLFPMLRDWRSHHSS